MSETLIAGCGYLGRRLGSRLLGLNHHVVGLTQTSRRLQDIRGLGIDGVVHNLATESRLPESALGTTSVFVLIPPGPITAEANRCTAWTAIGNLLKALDDTDVKHGVMVSSTAVYGDKHGQRVDPDTVPAPDSRRGQALLDLEQLWLAAPFKSSVVRLAGIYGPQRVIGAKQLTMGTAITGSQTALLNLIHVDDAVALLLKMLSAPNAATIELGSDGSPVQRCVYYRYLADRLGVGVTFESDTLQNTTENAPGRTSKFCDNTPTRLRTGWNPVYPNFKWGLDAILGT